MLGINGFPEYNKFGDDEVYYNENDIFNKMMEIIYRYNTVEEQVAALRAKESLYRWIPTIVDLLENDPSFQTDAFVNFRKDFIKYYKEVWQDRETKEIKSSIVNES